MHAQHTPFLQARKDLAEAVFLARWKSLNADLPNLLPDILDRNRADVRSARIAASFITWIGTNAGAGFIHQAKSHVKDFGYAEPAYLAAWALANQRKRWVNSGVRAIEVILSPQSLFHHESMDRPAQRAARLNISLSDIDVVESLVVWLSTSHGDAFVTSCMAQYETNRMLARTRQSIELAHARLDV